MSASATRQTIMRDMYARLALGSAAVFLFAAVALGAFGAHALKARLEPEMMAVYQTAVQYHFWHGLGLLGAGILLVHRPDSAALATAAVLLVVGVVLFSGSLYVLALTGTKGFGLVTPVGGLAFLGAWAALAWAAWRW